MKECENPGCGVGVSEDGEFVHQRSTRHERWFCSMDCAVESQEKARARARMLLDLEHELG